MTESIALRSYKKITDYRLAYPWGLSTMLSGINKLYKKYLLNELMNEKSCPQK